jgi:hypothetical protein
MGMHVQYERELGAAWRLLLLTSIIGFIAMGLVLVLSPTIGEQLFYIVYYGHTAPPEPFSPEAHRYIRFSNGVLGSMMIGWVALLLKLAMMRSNTAAISNWSAIRLSIGVWFVIDTGFSLVHGIYGNILLNSVAAIGFLGPLVLGLRRQTHQKLQGNHTEKRGN